MRWTFYSCDSRRLGLMHNRGLLFDLQISPEIVIQFVTHWLCRRRCCSSFSDCRTREQFRGPRFNLRRGRNRFRNGLRSGNRFGFVRLCCWTSEIAGGAFE